MIAHNAVTSLQHGCTKRPGYSVGGEAHSCEFLSLHGLAIMSNPAFFLGPWFSTSSCIIQHIFQPTISHYLSDAMCQETQQCNNESSEEDNSKVIWM